MSRDVVDMTVLDRDIRGELQRRGRVHPALVDPVDFAQPHHRQVATLPDYVKHREGITEIGAVTAEAIIAQYEMAARAVEQMGEELKRLATRCDEVKGQAMTGLRETQETAAKYRADAKRLFEEIEACALMVQEVTNTCGAVRDKIGPQI